MKKPLGLNPNPMFEGISGIHCLLTSEMDRNLNDPEFKAFVSRFTPNAFHIMGNTVYFIPEMLANLRTHYKHFFGSTF